MLANTQADSDASDLDALNSNLAQTPAMANPKAMDDESLAEAEHEEAKEQKHEVKEEHKTEKHYVHALGDFAKRTNGTSVTPMTHQQLIAKEQALRQKA